MSSAKSSFELIEDLVSFDTTSRNSNLELIEFIKGLPGRFRCAIGIGLRCHRQESQSVRDPWG